MTDATGPWTLVPDGSRLIEFYTGRREEGEYIIALRSTKNDGIEALTWTGAWVPISEKCRVELPQHNAS